MATSTSPGSPQPRTTGPFSDRDTTTQSESTIELKPEIEKQSSRGQGIWDESMKEIDLTTSYRKVSAMIIRWDQEQNADKQAAQFEISELKKVFQRYNYDVREAILGQEKPGQTTQKRIKMEISKFVYDEDLPQTLLIVYAAGHGIPTSETGKFLLSSSSDGEASNRLNNIVWEQVEAHMKDTDNCDVLLILDCCHAGKVVNMRGHKAKWSGRIFQFLGACGPTQTTPLPGPESFTSALIWALNELADGNVSFFSAELLDKVREYQHLNKDQGPYLNEWGVPSWRKLTLEPLSADSGKIADFKVKYGLNLTFFVTDFLDEKEITELCEVIRNMITSHRLSAKRVQWRGYYDVAEATTRRILSHWSSIAQKKGQKSLSAPLIDTTTPSLAEIGSQLLAQPGGQLLTPEPSEITLNEGDAIIAYVEEVRMKVPAFPSPNPRQAVAQRRPWRPWVPRGILLSFLLFSMVATCIWTILLFDVRNILLKIASSRNYFRGVWLT